uniref:Uncharacterized protein n=1 Tax=Rhizophora mucronata TaxID=61149 RepID=A0A2P2QJR9_RHIMU
MPANSHQYVHSYMPEYPEWLGRQEGILPYARKWGL